MSALDAVLEELAELVAAKVLARMAAPSSHYGTGRAGTLPPGKTKAWALRTLKTIPGARKVGRDWQIAVSDFDAWLSEQDAARVTKTSSKERPSGLRLAAVPDIEESLRAAGLRRAR